MSRSLTLKLTAVVLSVSLISVLLVAMFTRYATVSAFDRLLQEQAQNQFIAEVTDYYTTHGSWIGINLALRQVPGAPDPSAQIDLVLVNPNGHVVIPDRRYFVGQFVHPDQIARGIPIVVDGVVIGTVIDNTPSPVRNPAEILYLRRTTRALILAAAGSMLLAVLLGGLWARTLTRPLRELTAATQALAQGALEQQVPVRTEDELGELAASFNRMSADLARSNQARRQMTADIAHDLRTPLTVIRGYTEALRDGDLPPTTETFETMYLEAAHLSRLIDDLRTLSLADAGELTLNRLSTPPGELLTQALAAYRPQADAAGVTLTAEVEEGLPDVFVDPERMARVLGNLVGNALRYTPAGGRITLGARAHAGSVGLRVCDDGVGIAPEDLPHIFDRFYRGDAARQTDEGESGLGLAIAKSLVEAHGGTISVDSTPGRGTTFEVALPTSGNHW
ncbi:MAG: HAMP domain-containing protein [Anaerolineae bacterium]|nr:HAMP domain-containing protein [Anaerolineae bacterium]